MRFLLDANMPRAALSVLLASGHSASHVRDEGLADATDARIAEHCRQEGAILLTRDLDFADIRAYPPGTHPGIVVVRVSDAALASEVAEVVGRLAADATVLSRLPGRLAILETDRIRLRPGVEG